MAVDLNKPVENPRLKELLKQRANTPADSQMGVLNQIAEEFAMRANLLAVVQFSGAPIQHNPDGTAVFPEGAQIGFPCLSLKDGEPIQPFFTDWEELRKWEPFKTGDVSTNVMPFEQIYAMASGNKGSIVINPFGDPILIPFDMLDHISKVKESQKPTVEQKVVQKDTRIQIGQPKDYPQEMVDSISTYAKTVSEIEALWLFLMMKEGEKSFLIVVDAQGDPRRFFQNIANEAVPYLPKGMFIDMVPANEGFGKEVSADAEPFYRKG